MKLNRLFALMLALVMAFAAVSFAAAEDAPTLSESDVLVTVNGTPITRGEIYNIANHLLSTYMQYGYDVSDPNIMTQISTMAVDFAIQYVLMDQQAAARGFDQFTEEEMNGFREEAAQQWNTIVNEYVYYYGSLTPTSTEEEITAARTEVIAMLESEGYTEEMVLDPIVKSAIYDRLEADMVAGAVVTEADVLGYYESLVMQDEANYGNDVATYEYMTQYYGQPSYYVPAGYRGVTHILLNVDENMLADYQGKMATFEEEQAAIEAGEDITPTVTQEELDAMHDAIIASVQPTVDEINEQLNAGVPFADLIAIYGNDPGMTDPTRLAEGYPVHMDSIVWDPAFVKGAFSVSEVGQWSEPVLGSYGVHIVYYLRDVPAGAVELTDDMYAALYDEMLVSAEDELFNTQMQAWFEESEIEYSTELTGE